MATLGSINHVNLTKIGAINHVNISKAGAFNHVNITVGSADSVSANPTFLSFGAATNLTNSSQITSSGTWSAAVWDEDVLGMINSVTASGSSGQNCTINLAQNSVPGSRSAIVRVTVGTATADIEICQSGTEEVCPE